MIDSHMRSALPAFTKGIIAAMARRGIQPNHVTIAAAFISSSAAVFAAIDLPVLAIFVWWLGRLGDGLDGILARHLSQASPFGAYLDIVCDMFAYSVMVLGLALLHPGEMSAWLLVLVGYVLCITSALAFGSMLGEIGEGRTDNRGIRLGAGLAEAGETGIAYTLMLLFPDAVPVLVWIWIVVLTITVGARSVMAFQSAKSLQA